MSAHRCSVIDSRRWLEYQLEFPWNVWSLPKSRLNCRFLSSDNASLILKFPFSRSTDWTCILSRHLCVMSASPCPEVLPCISVMPILIKDFLFIEIHRGLLQKDVQVLRPLGKELWKYYWRSGACILENICRSLGIEVCMECMLHFNVILKLPVLLVHVSIFMAWISFHGLFSLTHNDLFKSIDLL